MVISNTRYNSIYQSPNESDHNKPILVLLHGWGFNSSIWQTNTNHLKDTFQILPIDLNGHGTELFNPEFHNIDLYLEYLISKMILKNPAFNNKDINISILGWSLGGIIALHLKNKFPQYFKNLYLCCSTPCFLNRFINNNIWEHGVTQEVWDKFSNDLLSNYTKTINTFMLLQTVNTDNSSSKDLYRQLINIIKNSQPASIDGLLWGLNLLQQDYRYLLKSINNTDITFILGKRDRLVNASLVDWLKQNHSKITVHLLKNSGHMPFITEPEIFYKTLT